MYQRDLIRKAWADAGLYDSKDAKLQEFLKHVDDTPLDCWPELVDAVRTQYPEYIERLVVPVWDTGDKLFRLNLIRAIDLNRKEEHELLTKLVRRSKPEQDTLELRAAVLTGDKSVLDQVLKKRKLPNELRAFAELRRARRAP